MTTKSLSNLDLFKILDKTTNQSYYGCHQLWYPKKWQRLSGCGPTVATNLFFYLSHNQALLELEKASNSKENWIALMEEIWEYVTPSMRGVHTTQMFYTPLRAFMESKGLNVEYRFFNIPKEKSQRPEFHQILNFIDEALTQDVPIAFLNLDNGEAKNLDRYHWVTLISLEYTEDGTHSFVNILDEGRIKRVDLCLWFQTTTLGGGFVYFKIN
ncbi:hypothetical protein [Desulfitobacterium metallireducens]|uniref:Peptidase C39-like domain-containing protein n=1 Tax=Desulfitobacterium metallireducens DSM 15288 TaxID=871968 RepID=W0E6N7_9FIRM|nr:hypothetical protein [Desulfitobacterium metallireducens]AHF06560.1 hypothetical protein DESME_05400 [Desulfitobacterium metallireducens DSM 15288]